VSDHKHIMCVICRSVFSDEETAAVDRCPTCGATGIPADTDDMVALKITRHELRILTMWASNYAHQIATDEDDSAPKVVSAIIRAIHRQDPTVGPLTLAEELQEVADTFGSHVESSIGDFDPQGKH
jgi:hypothetical protein